MRTRLVLAGVVAIGAAGAAARSTGADTIVAEWNGDFEIPDIVEPPGVFIDLTVEPPPSGADVIRDVDVGFRIPHTWQGDLSIMLEHVDTARLVPLTERPAAPACGRYGFSADDYGDEATGEPFTLDDEAPDCYDVPDVACPGQPRVTGRWRPNAPLSALDGDRVAGTWRLWIADEGGGDVGRVRHIVIRFETDACAADVNGDASVGLDDLLAVLAGWGRCPPDGGDVDDDGDVDLDDLLAVLSAWGPCPAP